MSDLNQTPTLLLCSASTLCHFVAIVFSPHIDFVYESPGSHLSPLALSTKHEQISRVYVTCPEQNSCIKPVAGEERNTPKRSVIIGLHINLCTSSMNNEKAVFWGFFFFFVFFSFCKPCKITSLARIKLWQESIGSNNSDYECVSAVILLSQSLLKTDFQLSLGQSSFTQEPVICRADWRNNNEWKQVIWLKFFKNPCVWSI